MDDDVKIGVILAMSPIAVQSHCHLNAPDRKTSGMEMTDPMDLSAVWKGKGKGDKGGRYDKGGKHGRADKGGKNGKNGKGRARDGKGKNHDGKGKTIGGKTRSEPFDGHCTYCRRYGHKQLDCWAKARDNASGSTATVEKTEETVPATAGSLLYGDQV